MYSKLGSFCGLDYRENSVIFDSFATALPRNVTEASDMSDKNLWPRANLTWEDLDFEENERENWQAVYNVPGHGNLLTVRDTAGPYYGMFGNHDHFIRDSQDSRSKPDYDSCQESSMNVLDASFPSAKPEDSPSATLTELAYPSNKLLEPLIRQPLDSTERLARKQTFPEQITVLSAVESSPLDQNRGPPDHKNSLDSNPKFPHRPLGIYPDVTTLINSDSSVNAPMVESTFVDHTVCHICQKRFTRDMNRHLATHEEHRRFNCVYPKHQCNHKTGLFNRRYDFKKHLLNRHFIFDSKSIKRTPSLRDKLKHWGTCTCGARFQGQAWVDTHILTDKEEEKCPLLRKIQHWSSNDS